MTKFFLWLIVISAQDGSQISERVISQPVPIAQCIELQAGRVSHASDGKVERYECRRAEVT